MDNSQKIRDLIEKIKPDITKFMKEDTIEFSSGLTPITVGWPIIDEKEILLVLETLLDKRLSQGANVKQFEKSYAEYNKVNYGVAMANGTLANYLALQTLIETGELKRGDEIIMPASTFAAVPSPAILLGLVPVFVDIDPVYYNIDPIEIEKAITKKTKAIFVVHSLGVPADIPKIIEIAKKHNLKVLEDCCEAHSALINGKMVGSFGDMASLSFFVAHNMTTGEGGMILTNNCKYQKMLLSLREFGRLKVDERYPYVNDKLKTYDRRYTFEHVGLNGKFTDPQAALGIEQLKKLDHFNTLRKKNAVYYQEHFKQFYQYFQLPSEKENTENSWYAYTLVVKKDAPFTRNDIAKHLSEQGIENRPFLAGSLPDQPAFEHGPGRVVGDLHHSKWIRDNAFFIGVHPGITETQQKYVVETIKKFIAKQNEEI